MNVRVHIPTFSRDPRPVLLAFLGGEKYTPALGFFLSSLPSLLPSWVWEGEEDRVKQVVSLSYLSGTSYFDDMSVQFLSSRCHVTSNFEGIE